MGESQGSPRRGRTARASGAALAAAILLSGCSDSEDVPVLTWYINPDDGGQVALAQVCTEEAEGAYVIQTSLLPADAPSQREQLARRLAANDSSLDIMSLDPPFIPELAEPEFLAPVPDDVAERTTEDTLEGALAGAMWNDELVTVPFWANTQLLWYRKSVVEEAGLDMEQPITWDQVIDTALEQDKLLGVQGVRAESMTVWLNALVESQDESILANPEAPAAELQTNLDTEQGMRAAEIIGLIGTEGLAGPGVASMDENQSMLLFQRDEGSFMVNWPFVWPATNAAAEEGALDEELVDDIGWAQYPRVDEDTPSAPPLGGINLAVGADSLNQDLAFEAIECIVQPENQTEYFITNGNPPSSEAAYEDPALEDNFPMADAIREALENAAPRPQTPFYNEISTAIQQDFTPISGVRAEQTPAQTDAFIVEVLRGERLL
ncbi:extracellular solute-binding protein [Nesterenkonia sp. LB17]|uniref:extracellular solute-binding protein n=1 Tax=unclassified Nesterenkonia TaxID=2629769 RepID=UPI001F4D1DB8|nr:MULTISPECIES: extracellular solute-binding protein [unclassified Nesterenkonia]MCH8561177.1 extracellular solute-binding protein [Nesterenkonia sp. DZ6]MCH8562521.1 extracellular solute-binding protein [Nesterenkonia sp. YGD6]MCH8565446.1 extracellular solute-binding protein [Nesterenkonia sp. LB17]MCH8571357.1 extracellular solute-binding protein [Nesterenkonia sp. AY15]